MKDIYGIIKKEFDKIFKFPRMIFSTLVLPGLLIFVIYAIMGSSFSVQEETVSSHEGIIYIVNSPSSYQSIIENVENVVVTDISIEEIEDVKTKIFNNEADVLISFAEDFDEAVLANEKPQLDIYYNPTNADSSAVYGIVQATLNVQKDSLLNEMGIDSNIITVTDNPVYDERMLTGTVLAMLIPMFVMISIFASSMGIGTDAIAGEKERGTLATLLMTPIKKNAIIIGKIISTAVITIFSALSSFVGLVASLPFAKSLFSVDGSIQYGFSDYLMLFAILIVIALLASSFMLLVSTIAKSTKEASAYAMPIYIIAILTSTFTMFNEEATTKTLMYLVPIYNCTLGLKAIFSFQAEPLLILLAVASSILYISIIIVILLKMFKSERVMFAK